MAARSWASAIAVAIGAAAVAGAAQLGLAYGLDIVSWIPGAGATAETVWVDNLAWVAWLAGVSTVIGALTADRLGVGAPAMAEAKTAADYAVVTAWRVVIALSAAVGALITVPLIAVPARAPRPDNVAPYFTAGGYAVAGVIVGLLVAVGALAAPAVAANAIASTGWVWLLATVAVIDGLRAGDARGSAQLATWKFTDAVWVRGLVNLPGAFLMLAVALTIGVLAAWTAGRRGDNRIGVAVSGAAGPLLVAAAYFLAAPSLGERDQHLSTFVMAPYAVLAGLAGSVLVAAIGPKGARAHQRAVRRRAPDDQDARSAAEFTDWTRALAVAPTVSQTSDTSASEPRHADDEGELHEDSYAPARAYPGDPAVPDAPRADQGQTGVV
jgi:hypothetical protein